MRFLSVFPRELSMPETGNAGKLSEVCLVFWGKHATGHEAVCVCVCVGALLIVVLFSRDLCSRDISQLSCFQP